MEVEDALEGEPDDHLGYARHDPESRDGGNSRNGHTAKTVSPRPGRWRFRCCGTGIPERPLADLRVGAISVSCAQVAAVRGVAGEPACKRDDLDHQRDAGTCDGHGQQDTHGS